MPNDRKQRDPMTNIPPHVVVLVHGIRTQASWAEMVSNVLSELAEVDHIIPIRYGYFHIFRFLTPVFTRTGPIRKIARELRDIRKQYPAARISVVAHSFGTYAMSKILDNETDIVLDRLILCGCIIPQDFRWDKIADQVHSQILNDCGTRDVLPILAKSATWGFGPSGTFGFGTSRVRDRFHRFSHSDFFNADFVTEYWVPYIRDGTIKHSEWDIQRPTPPFWQSLLGLVKLPVVAVLLAALLVALPWVRASLEDRAIRVVCLVPTLALWERLPEVGGAVTSPILLRISYKGQAFTADTLRQRPYCAGGSREKLEQVVLRKPGEERYPAVRAYLQTLSDDPAAVNQAFGRLTGPRPGFLSTPVFKTGEAVRVEVVRNRQEGREVLFDTSFTLGPNSIDAIMIGNDHD